MYRYYMSTFYRRSFFFFFLLPHHPPFVFSLSRIFVQLSPCSRRSSEATKSARREKLETERFRAQKFPREEDPKAEERRDAENWRRRDATRRDAGVRCVVVVVVVVVRSDFPARSIGSPEKTNRIEETGGNNRARWNRARKSTDVPRPQASVAGHLPSARPPRDAALPGLALGVPDLPSSRTPRAPLRLLAEMPPTFPTTFSLGAT